MNNNIKKAIAYNIRRTRRAAGISQKELAAKLGVAPSAVSNWENGQNSIDTDRLFVMCEILGVTIHDMYLVPPGTSPPEEEKKEKTPDINVEGLSPAKLQLIQAVQSLPDEQAASLLQLLEAFLANDSKH